MGSGPNEERKDKPAGSQSVRQEPTETLSLSDFSPLQAMDAAFTVHTPFSHMKVCEEAESSNQAQQAGLANCLRFSPALSSDHVVITDNGKCAFSQLSIIFSNFIRATCPADLDRVNLFNQDANKIG